jgi:UDP-N-acetylmuramoyl-tripeptide--D-alanyl-D-alanine ligase
MLELGPDEMALHAGLSQVIAAAAIDRVYLAGSRMKALWEVLPPGVRGAWREAAAELSDDVLNDLRPGDVVMIKGSNGSKAGLVAKALLASENS